MAFELAVYGATAGIMHRLLPAKKPWVYVSLVVSMIMGRAVWGIATFICIGMSGGSFTLAAFAAGAVTNAIPGIVIQILLIPVLVMLAEHPRVLGKKP